MGKYIKMNHAYIGADILKTARIIDLNDNSVSIDSNGYYSGDNLTIQQELHNLNIDKQIGSNNE
jgi:hypothetical protein